MLGMSWTDWLQDNAYVAAAVAHTYDARFNPETPTLL